MLRTQQKVKIIIYVKVNEHCRYVTVIITVLFSFFFLNR